MSTRPRRLPWFDPEPLSAYKEACRWHDQQHERTLVVFSNEPHAWERVNKALIEGRSACFIYKGVVDP